METEKNPIQVADRLFGALEFLAEKGQAGLMEVSNHLGLNKTTAHRVLNSLIFMGYARQNENTGKYEMTMKLMDVSNQMMKHMNVVHVVRPHLRRLMELSGETVHFVERDGNEAVYIDKIESFANGIQMISHIGSRLPLYCSGVGKAMAAGFEPEEVEQVWKSSKIVSRTPYTITSFEEFRRDLDQVRERGYALDNEENESGVRCIAASIKGYTGKVQYAFSISAPVNRMYNDRIAQLAEYVLAAKRDIQKEFG